ncbi:hypothetical protein G6F59_017532 [Rhizopus arrhizus]|nr:hypothetical protein G6F59_017532 [Rhizopus arrhizus]
MRRRALPCVAQQAPGFLLFAGVIERGGAHAQGVAALRVQGQRPGQVGIAQGVGAALVVIAGAQGPHHRGPGLFAHALFAQGEHLRVVVAVVGAVDGFDQTGHAGCSVFKRAD